jgi:hypothetical protein
MFTLYKEGLFMKFKTIFKLFNVVIFVTIFSLFSTLYTQVSDESSEKEKILFFELEGINWKMIPADIQILYGIKAKPYQFSNSNIITIREILYFDKQGNRSKTSGPLDVEYYFFFLGSTLDHYEVMLFDNNKAYFLSLFSTFKNRYGKQLVTTIELYDEKRNKPKSFFNLEIDYDLIKIYYSMWRKKDESCVALGKIRNRHVIFYISARSCNREIKILQKEQKEKSKSKTVIF